jgi:hypothetical protein
MDPLCLALTGKLVDMGWDAFSGPVKKYVERLFGHKAPDQLPQASELKRSDGVATGVAIGYFHNFLKPLDDAIAYAQLIIFASESKKQATGLVFTAEQVAALGPDGVKQMSEQNIEVYSYLGSFDSEHFDLVIVYPCSLRRQNFNRVNDYLRGKTQRGSYYNRPNARTYGLNYTLDSDTEISLKDYARPIEAIQKYYSEDKKCSQAEIDQIQKEEIEVFLATIYRLCDGNTQHIFGKMKFLAIE